VTGPLLASYIVLWVLVGVLAVAVFAIYHHFGQMYLNSREGRQTQGPEEREPLRRSVVEDLIGQRLEIPRVGRRTLVLFAGTDCPLCGELLPELRAFVLEHDDIEPVVICAGEKEKVRAWARDLPDVTRVVADPRQRVTARYRIGVMPFVVAADDAGVVRAKGIVNDRNALEYLAAATEPDEAHAGPLELVEVEHDRLN
jgi:methylamine dehydrogenase accessory protein MauD